ncbi:MAG: serine/threonine protein kinase [Planctomycetaceae bacterium]|nr:serine/threonine protein kinase [Planctomycetaceae bacterium]
MAEPPSGACPSNATLRGLLAGELPPDEEQAASRHLEACPVCERMALQISDDNPTRALLDEHRRAVARADAAPSQLDELRERLHVLGWFSESAAHSPAAASAKTSFDDGTQAGVVTGSSDARPAPTFGKFEIVQPVGSGAFGMVYLARDRVLNRQVALKLARTSVLADPDLKSRFMREAEALARLSHPGIVPVFEAGEHDGTCYLAVGFCSGPTLEQWLREKVDPVEPRLAARIALALAEAVEHAHQHGILHRDIKPSNILFDGADAGLAADLPFIPKLTDFGLAKMAEQPSGATISGMVLGTLQYMATEQAAGLTERIGPPTDVYSLGAVLYELLTGQPPIRGATAIDTLRRVLVDEPPHPQQFSRRIPDDLAAIVMRCLDKSPTRRYLAAADLAADLARFLEGKPTLARPLSMTERATRWVRRNQAVSAVLALTTVVVALGVGLVAYDQRLKRMNVVHERQRAESAYRDDIYTAGQVYAAGDVVQTVELLQRQRPAPGRPDSGRPDLRSFEWHYLWALTTRDTFALAHPGKDVYQLCLSPDSRQLAAASADGCLYLYDARTLASQRVIKTAHVEINGVAYFPDGHRIATAGDDGFVRIWDAVHHGLLREWRAHNVRAYGVVFYDGGRKLATCGDEPVIRLWDAQTLAADGVLEGHTGPVESIVHSPVEELLASASKDHDAIVWDLNAKNLLHRLHGHDDKLSCLAFSPDGKWLATGGNDRAVSLWRPSSLGWADRAEVRKRSAGQLHDPVQSLAFTHDGRLLAGDRAGAIRAFYLGEQFPDSALEKSLHSAEEQWLAHNGRAWSLVTLKQPGRFLSAGGDGEIRAWRQGKDLISKWQTDRDAHYAADYPRDGTQLFVLRERAGIEVYDPDASTRRFTLQEPDIHWDSLAVLKGREQVAAASKTGDIVIWNWRTRNRLFRWKHGDATFQRLIYSPAARLLAAIAYQREDVLIIDPDTGREVAALAAPSCTDCAFSPDGQRLAVDTMNRLAIYDLKTQRQIALAAGHTNNINAIAYSPGGELIATVSNDRTARLWTPDGKPASELIGHPTEVLAVTFTADGRSLITGGNDGRIRVFHVATRRELLSFPSGFRMARRLWASPDNRHLAVIGDNWEVAHVSLPRRGED